MKDFRSNPVELDTKLAVWFPQDELRSGTVTGFTEDQDGRRQIYVRWTGSNHFDHMRGKTSKIYADLSRFVVLL